MEDLRLAGIPVGRVQIVSGAVYQQVRILGRLEARRQRRRLRRHQMNAAQRHKRERRKTLVFIGLCVLIVIAFIKAPDSNQVRSWMGKGDAIPAHVQTENVSVP